MDAIWTYCQNGNFEYVQRLINQGVDINRRDGTRTGRTPLYVASKFGHVDIVRLLISYGSDINVQTLDERSSPLHIKAPNIPLRSIFYAMLKKGKVNVVRELLAYDANTRLKNICGQTPLHFATSSRSFNIVNELIKHGATIHEKDNKEMNIEHVRCSFFPYPIGERSVGLWLDLFPYRLKK
jgi:ankyrin repeat protein